MSLYRPRTDERKKSAVSINYYLGCPRRERRFVSRIVRTLIKREDVLKRDSGDPAQETGREPNSGWREKRGGGERIASSDYSLGLNGKLYRKALGRGRGQGERNEYQRIWGEGV